jgi:hypothetical protein
LSTSTATLCADATSRGSRPTPTRPDCSVARLRLPDWHSEVALARLLFGVVDADAARWLTDAERRASRAAALDPDAQQRWQEWERRAPNE